MVKVKDQEAIQGLLKLLQRFLKTTGKKREELARKIDDYASWDLMDDNSQYERYHEDLKAVIDSLFIMHKWKGRGVTYGTTLFFGTKQVKDLIGQLKKMRK